MYLADHAGCCFLKQAEDYGMNERYASSELQTGGEPTGKSNMHQIGFINEVGVIDENSLPSVERAVSLPCSGEEYIDKEDKFSQQGSSYPKFFGIYPHY